MAENNADEQPIHPLGKRYARRMDQAHKDWEATKKDPRPTHEMLDQLRRRFAPKGSPQE
jgi:hypothetical protein